MVQNPKKGDSITSTGFDNEQISGFVPLINRGSGNFVGVRQGPNCQPSRENKYIHINNCENIVTYKDMCIWNIYLPCYFTGFNVNLFTYLTGSMSELSIVCGFKEWNITQMKDFSALTKIILI